MANIVITEAVSGTEVAANQVGSVKHQAVMMEFGGVGDATQVSGTNPLPTVVYDGSSPVTYGATPQLPPTLGEQITDLSMSVILAADTARYQKVAAGATAVLGAGGTTGDYLGGITVTPASTAPGNIIILDGATSITMFVGGIGSVSNLIPFFIPIGAISVNGAWSVTCGSNVQAFCTGRFST